MEECKSRFSSNKTFLNFSNIMMTLINAARMYKQNVTVSLVYFYNVSKSKLVAFTNPEFVNAKAFV